MEMMQQYVQSYKDLPQSVYQFQTKLRNELRSKSGIMRGREFIMKDMYSLHASQEDCDAYYDKVIEAYKRCFERFGIEESTYVTFASGGAFTQFSHEFQTICDAGEDVLYVNADKSIAVNEEVLDEATAEIGVDKSALQPVTSAEVGNIFKFGTQKSEQMGIYYTDESGAQKPIYLASYGIGITRVMGVIVEKFADDKGIVWPESVAPAKVYLARLGEEAEVITKADELESVLTAAGIAVLYDDRDERPGKKFADAELLGIPYRVVVSSKTISGAGYELKQRTSETVEQLSLDDLVKKLAA
jgi:prolyl-tRNA synthetase